MRGGGTYFMRSATTMNQVTCFKVSRFFSFRFFFFAFCPFFFSSKYKIKMSVILSSSDNEEFKVDKEVAQRSVLIKNMLEGKEERIRLSLQLTL